MTAYQGDYAVGATVFVYFNTFDSNDPSASVTMTGLAVTDIEIYENATMTTRSSDNGYTLIDTDGIDIDSHTGVHGFSIDLSDNTDAGFFAANNDYLVIVDAITVDGATLSFGACTFSIENRSVLGTEISDIRSALVVVDTVADTIASDLILLSTKQDSDMVVVAAAHTKTQSDIVIIDDFLDTEIATIASDLIELDTVADTIASDLILAQADLDTTTSDLVVVTADVASLSTKQDSDMVVVAAAHTKTQSDIVLVEAQVWDRLLTGGTHNIANSAGRRLRTLQESGGAYGGQIYIDTVNGTAGTTDYENGTSDNHVLTLADAKTISASIEIPDFHIINGSSITLAESSVNESYFGDNWTLALGGQACAGAHFEGAEVSGIQTGSGVSFVKGEVGTVTLADDAHIDEAGLSGTITLPVGSLNLFHCHHDGAAAPILDFGAAVGSTTVHMHHYSGGIELQNFGDNGTDIVHLDGNGKLIINANSSGGTINIRGNWEIEDNDGNATINFDDRTANVASILVDTGTTLEARLSDVESSLVIVKSDLVISNSQTTVIESDTAVIEAAGGALTAGQDSKLTRVQSDVIIVLSDLVVIDDFLDTEVATIASDLIELDTVADTIASDLILLSTKQDSDMVVVAAAHTKTQSDIVIVDDFVDTEITALTSNLVIVASDTLAIEAAGGALSAAQDSKLTRVQSDVIIVLSDLVVIDDFIDTEIATIASDLIELDTVADTIASDLIELDTVADTVASDLIELDTVADTVASDLVLAQTDLDTTTSDLVVLTTNVASLSTKQDSDMVVVAAAHTKTQSDIVIVDDFVDTEITALTSNLVIVASDTVAIEAGVNITSISGDTAAADNLEASMETLTTGTATGSLTTTTMADSALTETTDDHFKGRIIAWRTGVLKGQATDITAYNGTTKVYTFTAITEAPGSGDSYVVV